MWVILSKMCLYYMPYKEDSVLSLLFQVFFSLHFIPRHHLSIWDMSMNKRDEDLCPHGAYIPVGEYSP